MAPALLEPKVLLQELVKKDLSWDDSISSDQIKGLQLWSRELPLLSTTSVSRCFRPSGLQLHHFLDASKQAYAACSYLRIVDQLGSVHFAFVIGKSRLTLLKSITILRLELSAAVLAVKLGIMVRKYLTILLSDPPIFWCDSTAVLQTIANNIKRFPTFVANRVAIIERNTNLSH